MRGRLGGLALNTFHHSHLPLALYNFVEACCISILFLVETVNIIYDKQDAKKAGTWPHAPAFYPETPPNLWAKKFSQS